LVEVRVSEVELLEFLFLITEDILLLDAVDFRLGGGGRLIVAAHEHDCTEQREKAEDSKFLLEHDHLLGRSAALIRAESVATFKSEPVEGAESLQTS
jgi:hypothetical protein